MKHPFKYYLHDGYEMGERESWLQELMPDVDPDIIEKAAAMRPFYEVTLECELDDETGEVTLISAQL